MSRRVLIAGIGNIFLGDDGFGVEVAGRLAARSLPPGVSVADFGIRGVHLAYELLEGYDALVLVDAVPMGEPPGTVAVIEPEPDGEWASAGDSAEDAVVDAHSMSPHVVLSTLSRLGGRLEHIYVVGCQPATLDEGIGLSPAAAAAIDAAVEVALDLGSQLVTENAQPAGKGT
jgi:hydrogenase maturation protease